METNFTPRDAGQGPGISGGRKDLTRGRDSWSTPDQPLRSPKAAVRGASTRAPARATLHGVAPPTCIELDQLRCQRSLQWSMQRTFASEDEGARHTGGSAPVGRGILLRTDGDHSKMDNCLRRRACPRLDCRKAHRCPRSYSSSSMQTSYSAGRQQGQ